MHHIVQLLLDSIDTAPPLVALLMVALGMMLESMCVPIPSELVLPVAGLWASRGELGEGPFRFGEVLVAVTLGCLIGSTIAYGIGFYGGTPLVEKFGRYIFVTPHRLEMAERWLQRFGPWAIVLGRLMFAVRALISLPVGILQLGYRKFILSTLCGCLIWNLVGVTLGYEYGQRVEAILHKMSVVMLAVLVLSVLVACGFYFWKTHITVPADRAPGADPIGPLGPDLRVDVNGAASGDM